MPEPPLAHISTVPARTLLAVKSWLPEPKVAEDTVSLGGHPLPSHVGTVSSAPAHALCLGPGEWLIVRRDHAPADAPAHGLVIVDLSDGLACLEVSGPAARDVLSKGCGLDLHPGAFGVGRCARTRLAQISVVIECLEALRFELIVARSHLHFLHAWLIDAAAEF